MRCAKMTRQQNYGGGGDADAEKRAFFIFFSFRLHRCLLVVTTSHEQKVLLFGKTQMRFTNFPTADTFAARRRERTKKYILLFAFACECRDVCIKCVPLTLCLTTSTKYGDEEKSRERESSGAGGKTYPKRPGMLHAATHKNMCVTQIENL